MIPDNELLRRYVEDGSEPAFAELVQRHVNLIYSAAVRLMGGDTHLAQDVAQTVFTALARQAPQLLRHPTLGGWLHTATHFAAHKLRRGEHRRQTREQEIYAMQNQTQPEPSPWEQLRPELDDAVNRLKAKDRDLLLLHYFSEKSHREIAVLLGLNESTTRKRVQRALEKLRGYFTRRGVTVSAALLATALAANSVQAAPAGLAANLTTTALTGAKTAIISTSLFKTFFLAMKTKTTLLVLTVLVLAAIPAVVEHRQIVQLQEQLDLAHGKKSAPAARPATAFQFGSDPQANLTKILSLTSHAARMRNMIDLAAGLDAKGVRALLDDVIKRPGNPDDQMFLSILLERMAVLDPQGALAWAKSVPDPSGRKTSLQTLFTVWAGIDPTAALSATSQIDDAVLRKNLQVGVLSDLADTDPQKALAALQNLPAMQESRNFRSLYQAVFSTWAGNDPAAASAAVMNLPANRMRVFAIQNVVDGWAATDPQGALAWAGTLPAGATRSNAVNSSLTQLAKTDPQSAISYASNLTDGVDRNNYLGQIARQWGGSDPAAALSWADQNTTGQSHDAAVQSILGNLSLTNPPAAQAYVEQMPDNALRDDAVSQLAVNWAESDPKAALGWMQGLNGGNPATGTVLSNMVNIVNDWAVVDPQGTAAYVQTLSGTPNFGRLMAQVGANWASADPSTALTWAQSLPADDGHDNAMGAVITQIAVQDPMTAWNDARQMLTGDAGNQTLSNIVTKWSAQSPADAATALAALPPGDLLDKTTSTLVANWLKHDPTAASQWINTLPPGDARDGAVTQIIATEGQNNLPVAFNWAASIGNEETKQAQMANVIIQWAGRDPAAATSAVQAGTMTDQQREIMTQLIQKGQQAK